MPFAFFKGEKSIEELVKRIFRPQEGAPSPAAPEAAAEILDANPQLHDLSSVAPGTVIVIPEAAPPVHPAEVAPRPPSVLAAASQRAAAKISALSQAIQMADSRVVEALKGIAALAETAAPSPAPAAEPPEHETGFGKRPSMPSADDIRQRLADVKKAQETRRSVFAATLKQM